MACMRRSCPRQSNGVEDAGLIVTNLPAAAAAHAAAIEPHLGRHAAFEDNVFAALNTAFLHDGALIIVPRNAAVEEPVHLLFIATQKETASHPRCLLVAESGSAVTVIEDYVALQEEAYFTNAVTEIALADNAQVNHVRVQREAPRRFTSQTARCRWRMQAAIDQSALRLARVFRAIT